jgi:hypothetical protein
MLKNGDNRMKKTAMIVLSAVGFILVQGGAYAGVCPATVYAHDQTYDLLNVQISADKTKNYCKYRSRGDDQLDFMGKMFHCKDGSAYTLLNPSAWTNGSSHFGTGQTCTTSPQACAAVDCH